MTNSLPAQTYKNCQSCGMPLKQDEKGGGTNADGARSAMYCSHCYENGRFWFAGYFGRANEARVREKIVGMSE